MTWFAGSSPACNEREMQGLGVEQCRITGRGIKKQKQTSPISHLAADRKNAFGSKCQAHVLHVLLGRFVAVPGFPDLIA